MSNIQMLASTWKTCTNCDLYKCRRQVVFGAGGSRASLLVLATHPGREEDLQGTPHVGEAGQRVRTLLRELHIPKSLVWLDTLLACVTPENREPQRAELDACRPRLHELINLLDPDLILAMGKLTVTELTGRRESIAELRGTFFRAQIPGRYVDYSVPVLATYHPGQFLRNPDSSEFGNERKWTEDFSRALAIAKKLKEIRKNDER